MIVARSRIRFRDFEFDAETLELWRGGEAIRLPPKPARALALLVERAGSLVTREELQAHVWPETVVEFDQGINTYVRQLRAILRDDAESPDFIETLPRRGYRFIAPVSSVGPQQTFPKTRSPLPRWVVYTSVVAVFVGIVLSIAVFAGRSAPIRLVVQPFTPIGGAAVDRFFVEGISEELITTMAAVDPDRLHVIGKTSAARARDLSFDELATRLDVDFVLEGSVRPADSGFRLSVRLLRTRDHAIVWSEHFDGPDRDMSTQRWLATNVTRVVAPSLGTGVSETAVREPASVARSAWLSAQHLLGRGTSEGAHRSLLFLTEVFRLDPEFAPAYVSAARAHATLRDYTRADSFLDQAFTLQASLPEAHLVRGQIKLRLWQLNEADHHLSVALDGLPGYAQAYHAYAYYLAVLGRHDEAQRMMRRAEDLDPLSNAVFGDAGLFDFWARRLDSAIRNCERATRLAAPPFEASPHRCMADLLERRGDAELARQHALHVFEIEKGPKALLEQTEGSSVARGLSLYKEWLLAAALSDSSTSPYRLAKLHAAVGDSASALASIVRAYQARDPDLIQMAVDPRLDIIRRHPRFIEIATAVGVVN